LVINNSLALLQLNGQFHYPGVGLALEMLFKSQENYFACHFFHLLRSFPHGLLPDLLSLRKRLSVTESHLFQKEMEAN